MRCASSTLLLAFAHCLPLVAGLTGWPANLGPSTAALDTSRPALPGGTIANDQPPGPFFQDFTAPFPTDTWWVGFGVGNQNAVAAGPFPFQSSALPSGIQFGLQTARNFDGTSVHMNTLSEYVVNAVEVPQNDIKAHKATQWDAQTVTVKYFSPANNNMLAYLVPGSPYMTFEYQNATPLFNSIGAVLTSINNVAVTVGATYSGTSFLFASSKSTYVVYFLTTTNVTLQVVTSAGSTTSVRATAPLNGVVRFAKVTSTAPRSVLDTYSKSYAKSVAMSYSVTGDVGAFKYTWQTAGTGALMLLSWPHHRKALVSPAYIGNLKYQTLKGMMKPVIGQTWTLQYSLSKIDFFALNKVDTSCMTELSQNLAYEVSQLTVAVPGDFYFWGGSIGRMSRLALIAEHIGRTDLIPTVVNLLKQSWQYWDMTNRTVMATYETNYGGLINGAGWNNSWVDFGNGYYNDHHFHYGYSLHAAAVIGRYDAQWLADHQYYLLPMARDICNPSPNDPYFTVARHVDFFAGHSWASGIANGAGSRDQESTTEAVNGYYGCYLYAISSNNAVLRDWSRLLLAQEQQSAQMYWHMNPNETISDDTVYPEQGMRNLVTVGNVMDYQSGAWLFWGAEKVQIAAIQILPLTPVNEYLYSKKWISDVTKYANNELTSASFSDDWKSVIWAAFAQYNPQAAYQLSETLHSWGSGNSASNTLYFIATRNNTSGAPICSGSSNQQVNGTYYLQDVATGLFVVSSSATPALKVSAASYLQAAQFTFGFMVNARSIQSVATGQYVTGDPNGQNPVSASRTVASGYEAFTVVSGQNGTVTIKALVNNQFLANVNGNVVNSATATPMQFKLVTPPPAGAFPVPASGIMKNVGSNTAISVNAGTLNLRLSTGTETGVTFNYAQLSNGAAWTIQNAASKQYVTGDPSGNYPLAAARGVASGWEQFKIIGVSACQFVILALNNNNFVAVNANGQLYPNGNAINGTTLFNLGGPSC